MKEAKKEAELKSISAHSGATATSAPATQNKNTTRNVLLILLGIFGALVLCCLCCIGSVYLLFQNEDFQDGYCESWLEDEAAEDDPFSICDEWVEENGDPNDTTGDDADEPVVEEDDEETSEENDSRNDTNQASSVETYEDIYFNFDYPANWADVTDEYSSELAIESPQGDLVLFNEILFDNEFLANDSGCNDYEESLLSGYANTLDSVENSRSEFVQVNGQDACEVTAEIENMGEEGDLVSFYFFDPDIDSYAYEFILESYNQSGQRAYRETVVDSFFVEELGGLDFDL